MGLQGDAVLVLLLFLAIGFLVTGMGLRNWLRSN